MKRLRHLVDIILFNPPYVPTDMEEVLSAQRDHGIPGSWAGGADGMEITNGLLRDIEVTKMMESNRGLHSCRLQDLLSERGKFYLVALEENNIPEIRGRMLHDYNLQSQVSFQVILQYNSYNISKVVAQRRASREFLSILRFSRADSTLQNPVHYDHDQTSDVAQVQE